MLASPCVPAQQVTTPNQTELDAAIRESLKLDRLLPTPASLLQKPPRNGARNITADQIDGVSQKSVTATGNVVLQQGNMEVKADRVDYDQKTDTLRCPAGCAWIVMAMS